MEKSTVTTYTLNESEVKKAIEQYVRRELTNHSPFEIELTTDVNKPELPVSATITIKEKE